MASCGWLRLPGSLLEVVADIWEVVAAAGRGSGGEEGIRRGVVDVRQLLFLAGVRGGGRRGAAGWRLGEAR